jgi:hypothetical protein
MSAIGQFLRSEEGPTAVEYAVLLGAHPLGLLDRHTSAPDAGIRQLLFVGGGD